MESHPPFQFSTRNKLEQLLNSLSPVELSATLSTILPGLSIKVILDQSLEIEVVDKASGDCFKLEISKDLIVDVYAKAVETGIEFNQATLNNLCLDSPVILQQFIGSILWVYLDLQKLKLADQNVGELHKSVLLELNNKQEYLKALEGKINSLDKDIKASETQVRYQGSALTQISLKLAQNIPAGEILQSLINELRQEQRFFKRRLEQAIEGVRESRSQDLSSLRAFILPTQAIVNTFGTYMILRGIEDLSWNNISKELGEKGYVERMITILLTFENDYFKIPDEMKERACKQLFLNGVNKEKVKHCCKCASGLFSALEYVLSQEFKNYQENINIPLVFLELLQDKYQVLTPKLIDSLMKRCEQLQLDLPKHKATQIQLQKEYDSRNVREITDLQILEKRIKSMKEKMLGTLQTNQCDQRKEVLLSLYQSSLNMFGTHLDPKFQSQFWNDIKQILSKNDSQGMNCYKSNNFPMLQLRESSLAVEDYDNILQIQISTSFKPKLLFDSELLGKRLLHLYHQGLKTVPHYHQDLETLIESSITQKQPLLIEKVKLPLKERISELMKGKDCRKIYFQSLHSKLNVDDRLLSQFHIFNFNYNFKQPRNEKEEERLKVGFLKNQIYSAVYQKLIENFGIQKLSSIPMEEGLLRLKSPLQQFEGVNQPS